MLPEGFADEHNINKVNINVPTCQNLHLKPLSLKRIMTKEGTITN